MAKRSDIELLFTARDVQAISTLYPAPLYHQLYTLLKGKIDRAELPTGTLLPSELAFAAFFSVARITVKRALDTLQTEALITRCAGRGSHVTAPAQRNSVLRAPLTGNLESLKVMGRETTVEVLSFSRVPAPNAICAALKLKPGTLVDRAIRVRRNQGEPFAYYLSHTLVLESGRTGNTANESSAVLPDRPDSSAVSVSGASGHAAMTRKSLKTLTRLDIFREMGIKLAEIDQVLNATSASLEVATALNLPVGAPVLSLTRTYIARDGRPVDHLLGLYRPDRFEYHMHLSTLERRRLVASDAPD